MEQVLSIDNPDRHHPKEIHSVHSVVLLLRPSKQTMVQLLLIQRMHVTVRKTAILVNFDVVHSSALLGSFRLDYEYEIECEYDLRISNQ